jgi:hypothetical protein
MLRGCPPLAGSGHQPVGPAPPVRQGGAIASSTSGSPSEGSADLYAIRQSAHALRRDTGFRVHADRRRHRHADRLPRPALGAGLTRGPGASHATSRGTEKPMRVSTLSFLLLFAVTSGCTNAGQVFTVSCGGAGADCNARAAEICPAGYDTVNSTLNAYERTMIVRCK